MNKGFWALLQLALEAPFICFNFSVLLCVIIHILKKNEEFCSGFFILYAMQSIADVITIISVGLTSDGAGLY